MTSIGERNFKRIGRSPFLRATLLQRFNGRCAKCRCSIADPGLPFYVHHLTYEHSCVYPELVTIQVQRIRRGVEGIYPMKVTDCERCSRETPEAFAACMSRVVPLCSGCHFKEHLADIIEAKKAKAAGNFDRNLIRSRVNKRYRDCHTEERAANSDRSGTTPGEPGGKVEREAMGSREDFDQTASDIAGRRSRRSYARVRKPNQVRFLAGMIEGVWMVVNLSKQGAYRHSNSHIAHALRILADVVERVDVCLADEDTELNL